MKRLFFAVTLKENKKLNELYETCKLHFNNETSIKWVNINQLHITLVFIGEVDDNIAKSIVCECNHILSEISVSILNLDCYLVFYHRRVPRVVGIKFEPNNFLVMLKSNIENMLKKYDILIEQRPFVPHITFGRVKHTNNVQIFEQYETKLLEKNVFHADKLILFQSTLTPQGSIYNVLWEFKF
ncbi:MAG: RNA 2',3'-cyclic phosphodiesterase [Bacteroidales bacterium]|nr:RNA 2',3'-cyclic phosphodiesterase [Bacteroidales bacterium]